MSDPQSLKEKANNLYNNRKFAEALQTYDAAIQADPSDTQQLHAVIESNKIAVYLQMGEKKIALDLANKLIQKKPDWPRAWQRLAAARDLADQLPSAIEAATKAVSLDNSKDNQELLKRLKDKLAAKSIRTVRCVRVLPGPRVSVVPIQLPINSPQVTQGDITPVFRSLGFAFRVHRVQTDLQSRLPRSADYDNPMACWFMISLETGFAPDLYQWNVGECIISRVDGHDFTEQQAWALYDYLSHLLDRWGDGPEEAASYTTPTAFQQWLSRYNKRQNLNLTFP